MTHPQFSFASLSDVNAIMDFMHLHWRKNHILSLSKDLLLHEFQEGNKINLGIAKNKQSELLGLFGFIKYNSKASPDLAGSLWKVTDEAQKKYPMLGIHLRNFVIQNIPHRFFAAPGAALQTKPIYQIINMNWNRMDQWFLINSQIKEYQLIKLSDKKFIPRQNLIEINNDIQLIKVTSEEQVKTFDFSAFKYILPYKDFQYVKKRFLNYLYFQYDIYLAIQKNKVKNLIICRRAKANSATAYRIVDFYGKEDLMPQIIHNLYQLIMDNGDEYLDFVCHGFNKDKLRLSGMNNLDFNQESITIPNFFEPLVIKNTPVYCVSDKTQHIFRQCKADGDQDRPNNIN